ncbi:MAG TPA: DUF4149 domain-containing protein [candidate division Zixibacteria bacterium]|nr:DUF4149 domain-containing protein [candidate division Zixibacteria bacterium]
MRGLYLLSVWLHVLAAAVWIGGMTFLALALVPEVKRLESRTLAASLIHRTASRFRVVGWVSLITLIATGTFNVLHRGFGWAELGDPVFWQSAFGKTLGAKLLLVAAILALSLLHDFLIGPRAVELLRDRPDSPEALALRRRASWLGRIVLLLALGAVALGVLLVRGPY